MDTTSGNILSLCTGYGGLDQAVEMVFPSSRVVAHVEIEAWAVENLASKMDAGLMVPAPVWSNLKTFDAEPFRGVVDIIIGGYPCQPFSVAGKRRGTEDPRHLWPYIRNIVDVIRPRICVFENVRGHVRLGLSTVLGELRELGYGVRAGIFAAAEVGAPHRRERIFILGILENSYTREQGEQGEARQRRRGSESTGRAYAMADTDSDEGGGRGGREKEAFAAIIDKSKNGLAHPHKQRPQGHRESGERADECAFGPGCERPALSLATAAKNARGLRLENAAVNGCQRSIKTETEQRDGHSVPIARNGDVGRWPAGPGQRQHDWEAPRTVNGKLNPEWVESLMGIPRGWTKIEGEPDDAWREDRLRLCGNGVVPAQAEYAIRTLLERDQRGERIEQ